MPAPLGKTPTKKMPNIQVFGMDDSSATRNTLRFFRERRIVVHYVDLRKKPIARGELQRFVERLGAAALLDDTSKPYREQGLGYLSMDASGTMTAPARRRRGCSGCRSSATASWSPPARRRRPGRPGWRSRASYRWVGSVTRPMNRIAPVCRSRMNRRTAC